MTSWNSSFIKKKKKELPTEGKITIIFQNEFVINTAQKVEYEVDLDGDDRYVEVQRHMLP